MVRKSKTRSTRVTKKTTPNQLILLASKWQKVLATSGKKTGTINLTASQVAKLKREIAKISKSVRSKTVQQIKAKIIALKSQQAKLLGVKKTSKSVNTTAVKRLKVKMAQINKCGQNATLFRICKGLKLTSYKNPTVKTKQTTQKVTVKRKTSSKTSRNLKREVTKHKRTNSLLRKLVAKFRKQVATLKRKYKAAQTKRRLRVIEGRKQHGKTTTSNVVRFNRNAGSSSAVSKQRRYG